MKLTEAKTPTDQSKSINLKEYTPINDECKPMPHADFYIPKKTMDQARTLTIANGSLNCSQQFIRIHGGTITHSTKTTDINK